MLMLMLMLSCGAPTAKPGPAPTGNDDTCGEGMLQDDGGTCVPVACGTSPWGADVPVDALHVAADAVEGGDGSEMAPLASVQEAVDLATRRGVAHVVVAAGAYGDVRFDDRHQGIDVRGRCREFVTVSYVQAAFGADVRLQDVSVAPEAQGLVVQDATVTLERVAFPNGVGRSILANGGEVRGRDVYFQGDFPGDGAAVMVTQQAQVTLEQATFDLAGGTGAFVGDPGSLLTLRDATLRGTTEAPGIYGVWAQSGGEWVAESTSFDALTDDAVVLLGDARATLVHSTVASVPAENDATSTEFSVQDASLVLDDVSIASARGGVIFDVRGSLDLTDVSIEGPDAGNLGASAVVASGDGARAVATRLTVLGVGIAMRVDDGASGDVSGFMTSAEAAPGVSGPSMVVVSGGASLRMADSTFSGSVVLQGASRAELVDVMLTDTSTSLFGQSSLRAERSVLLGPDAAVFVTEGSRVSLHDSQVGGASDEERCAQAVYGDRGAQLELDGVTLSHYADFGLYLLDADTLATVTDSTFTHGGPSAFAANLHQASARFATSSFEGAGLIGIVHGGSPSTVEVRDTRMRDLVGGAINTNTGAVAYVDGLVASRTRGNAIGVQGDGARMQIVRSSIEQVRRPAGLASAYAVIALSGASLSAQDLEITDTEGVGLVNLGATVTCEDCTLEANQFAGLAASAGSTTLVGGAILDTRADVSLGGGVGVYTTSRTQLALEGVTIAAHPVAGVWLGGDGAYRIEGCVIEGGTGQRLRDGLTVHGDGIFAREAPTPWDGTRGLLIAGNRMADNVGVGVFLDGSTATLEDNAFEANGMDLLRQRCWNAAAPVERDPVESREDCPDPEHLTLPLNFRFEVTDLVVEDSGARR